MLVIHARLFMKARLYQDKVPLKKKLDQITAWIDLPIEERPQLIMGTPPLLSTRPQAFTLSAAYEPSLDQAGHLAGPASELVNVRSTSQPRRARTEHRCRKSFTR